ncbi:MAG: hypothetical protein PHI12_09770 [Dehalococcoidales bacterium]|nr:hypothetical protein [Dehalococcoidales bacterium]
MTPVEITTAIKNQERVFFVENRNGMGHIVHCVPVAYTGDNGFNLVGCFIAEGIKTCVIELALLGKDAFEAHRLAAQRSMEMAKLSMLAWEYAANVVVATKDKRVKDGNLN